MSEFLTLNDVLLAKQRVLIREDFNVPIEDGVVINDLRIRAALPGIQQALSNGAQVLLMSHLGRPEAGNPNVKFSLKPVALRLQELLQIPVNFIAQGLEPAAQEQKITLYENVRFLNGETENDANLAQQMAKLCDVFVMDAFGSAHRAHASTVGVAQYAPVAVAGPLLMQETKALDRIMLQPQHPVVVIIGGAKISGKIDTLYSLINIADYLLIGGGMANTFLAARGYNVGASLYEPEQMSQALELLILAQQKNCNVILPQDVIIADGTQKQITEVLAMDKILDIGSATIAKCIDAIATAKTILWNGPVGVFQDPKFANGTKQIAEAIAKSNAYSVAGGGETIAALEQLSVANKISYISTGGGAFLEYLEGRSLPAILALSTKS